MSNEPQPSRDVVRASDADRDRVVSILQEALNQGRISPDEYAERTTTATSARTVGELRAVLDDLPVSFGDDPASVDGGDVVEWRGSFSSLKRKGGWSVPRRIVLYRRMGSVDLDFTEAHFTSQTVDIELDMIGGSIEVRVPDGASVALDEVNVTLGSVEDHRKGATPTGRPHFRFAGAVRWGSLEVRGPKKSIFK